MRVIQRLMGVDNPIRELTVYEHTLHFRGGVAVIESLTEREINRLRTFGFRVERDAKAVVQRPVPPVADVADAATETGPTGDPSAAAVADAGPVAPAVAASTPAVKAKAKAPAKARKED